MGQSEKAEKSWVIMPPVDFNKLVLPTFMKDMTNNLDSNLPLCPREYNE